MAYIQSAKNSRIYLFQDTVDLRLSIAMLDEEPRDIGRSLIKLRLDLRSLASSYRGLCIEEISFRTKRGIGLRRFNKVFYTGSPTENKSRELFIYIDNSLLNEVKLNGIALSIEGYLLTSNHSKYRIYQKFVVFERPAILDDITERQGLA